MKKGNSAALTPSERDGYFVTTQWTLVLSAGQLTSSEAGAALETLCAAYWYPLYAFARRSGRSAHDAQDLTQGFFARLLEKNYLAQVGREKGRFRSFLLAAFKHFLADEFDRANALKRGGGQQFISLDDEDAENRFALEPTTDVSPEKLYERQWALTVLEQALAKLRVEFSAKNPPELFESVKGFLNGDVDAGDYAPVAKRFDMKPGAVAVMIHRLRRRYRELVRAEVAHTVAEPGDVDLEMQQLLAALFM